MSHVCQLSSVSFTLLTDVCVDTCSVCVMYVCLFVGVCLHECSCRPIHTTIRSHVYMSVCVSVHVSVHACVHACVRACMHDSALLYTCIYSYTDSRGEQSLKLPSN